MANDVRLVIPDAGPLIGLAMADRLDLLERFTVPVATMDIVKAESLFKDWPGRDRLAGWFERNADSIEIIESPYMAEQMLEDIERGGRVVAPSMTDRPALVGTKGRSKTVWKSVIKQPDEHERR